MEETNKKPKGFERFLRKVEILGNKIPDPMLMFIVLALAVVVISGICSALGVSAVNPPPARWWKWSTCSALTA